MNINPFSTHAVTTSGGGRRARQGVQSSACACGMQSKELDFKNKGLGIKHNGRTVDGFGAAGEPGGSCAACPPRKPLKK